MHTTSLRTARREALNYCTKTESRIVDMSAPTSLRQLTEAQLRRQIRLSQKYYDKNRENFKKLKAVGKRSRINAEARERIRIRMSLMEDSQKRFERQLERFKSKAARRVRGARTAAERPRSSRSSSRQMHS